MPGDDNAEQPGLSTANNWPHYREPRTFFGKPEEDVDEWLKHYERVSKYNRWNAATKLANVVFFLAATALDWFDNHEDTLSSWATFTTEIKKNFGDESAKKKRAEQTLLHRAQVPGETCTAYIEAILKLCKLVNSRMLEEDKVGHLLKGIAEDVYNFLISKESLSTTADVIEHCRTFEALKLRRITPKFGRLANVTSIASVEASPPNSMADMIREIVREELSRSRDTFCHTQYLRHSSAPEEDVAALSTPWAPPNGTLPMDDRNIAQRYRHQPTERRPTYPEDVVRQQRDPGFSQRRDFVRQDSYGGRWRSQPLCYRCGIAGHIARYCRRRFPTSQDCQPPANTYGQLHTAQQRPPTSAWDPYRPSNLRSSSPASDRSVTPPPQRQRRSPSPRRRASPPPPGN